MFFWLNSHSSISCVALRLARSASVSVVSIGVSVSSLGSSSTFSLSLSSEVVCSSACFGGFVGTKCHGVGRFGP